MYVAPIAVTICFGLAFATALVLLVIPAMVLMLESAKYGVRDALNNLRNKKSQTFEAPTGRGAVRESTL